MKTYIGFWSYARGDDDAEDGRITSLANDIATEYGRQTGEKVDLFVDRDDLTWGADWQRSIDDLLASTAFFVPVITPLYLQRPQCRRELSVFAHHTRSLGTSSLVLPLLYIQPSSLFDGITDPLLALVNSYQRADWTQIRAYERTSSTYRAGVIALASQLAEASTVLERKPAADPAESSVRDDHLRALVTAQVDRVVDLAGATVEMNLAWLNGGHGAVSTADDARRLAARLDQPVREFTSRVLELIDALYQLNPASLQRLDPADPEDAEVIENVHALEKGLHAASDAAEVVVGRLAQVESFDRPLRLHARRLKLALRMFYEGTTVTSRWTSVLRLASKKSKGGHDG